MNLLKRHQQPRAGELMEEIKKDYELWINSVLVGAGCELKCEKKGGMVCFNFPNGESFGFAESMSKDRVLMTLKNSAGLHQIVSNIAYGKQMKLNLSKLTEDEKKTFNLKIESHIKTFRDEIKEYEERIKRLEQYLNK